MEVKLRNLFYGNNSRTIAIRQSLEHYKIMNIPSSFIWIIFETLLNMAMVRNFEVMLGQTLNHSV